MGSELIVVIATAGRPELLNKTLASLSECRRPDIYRGTIVIENGRAEGTKKLVDAYRCRLGARYLYVSEGNKSNALNHVLEGVRKGLIFFTDDDVRMQENVLCAYAEASAGVEEGQFYGGPVEAEYEVAPPPWLIDFLLPDSRGWRLGDEVECVRRGTLLGCNWAAFAKDLRNAGGFDSRKGPGSVSGSLGQEAEMQGRLLRNGVDGLYIPQAMVWHYVPREQCSPKWAARRAYRWGIQNGMDYVGAGPKLFGVSRWMYRTWIQNAFNVIAKSLSNDKKSRFCAYHKFRFFCGYMRGSRIAQKGITARL